MSKFIKMNEASGRINIPELQTDVLLFYTQVCCDKSTHHCYKHPHDYDNRWFTEGGSWLSDWP